MRLGLKKGFACSRNKNCLGYSDNLFYDLPEHIQNLSLDFPVDGELWWPGHPASDVKTGIIEESPELRFTGFFVWGDRRYPHEHLELIQSLGIETPVLLYDNYTQPDLKVLEATAEDRGFEGWVLKERFRIPFWWKFKLEDTYDLIITGWNVSTAGKHMGKLKSLRCSAYVDGELKEVSNVSGMDEKVRYAFDPDKDIGRIIEVKAQEIASKGRLRHPRFIRWRDDKNREECVIEWQK
jgi:hypothetical protein